MPVLDSCLNVSQESHNLKDNHERVDGDVSLQMEWFSRFNFHMNSGRCTNVLIDLMTSENSTVSYREEHIQELSQILSKMPQAASETPTDDHWTFVIAYNIMVISMGKFINYHGHSAVRFESSDQVKARKGVRS
ncbi:hypothetical protein QCA50_018695 [Cerrena zonata]|uniref:Ubiquitin-like protease family profile domain-containing protein n=1 Tax=Cerrena zonata TaxID=2478898 RepID=A0AAW0FLX8_9APHY